MNLEKTYKVVNGTSYDSRTPDDLIVVLEKVREKRSRVRLIYGDVETGKAWDEQINPKNMGYWERGMIGRSTGNIKIPLLIKTRRSFGGESILDHAILQVLESPGGRVLWTRPKYKSDGK